ncbi:Os03g0714100 [Oryza sativa Japonica Group]|uniref:Os03g0714100 protein n=3 Tax=Oryza sativa TaxID=4530 RepID=A0A0N7KHX9_ORYSJ|nr:hypothetical protein OsI_13276 [Oryza sativa Indica Group]EEE59809.1 hypothetical protein OsJ_12340 [Oryza sativa Japonica Group]KAB8093284.1 hypothetical protein EE612_020034 [Oryza sativa]BAH92343.1 Os03g0714100 [Oryza sativa Japonica Group]BAS86065.1 Os03g0714100 [Oryza sativa Japonica Group]|eukprot:NP_001173615.1 Os03g0714100 [Oryza sativa Japonica Group]
MQTIRWSSSPASLCFFLLMSLLVHSSHGARPSPRELQGWFAAAAGSSSAEKQLVDPRIIAAGAAGRVADVVAAPVMTVTTPAGAVGDDRRRRGGDDDVQLPPPRTALVLLAIPTTCTSPVRRHCRTDRAGFRLRFLSLTKFTSPAAV